MSQGTCVRCGAASTLRCAACKKVTYCSAQCQRQHWERGHRGQCKMLRSGATLADEVGTAMPARPVVFLPPLPLERFLFAPSSVQRMAEWEPGREQFHFSGCGFSNLGNTCFANAVLQCLAYTSPLAMYLQSKQHSKACKVPTTQFCAACELERITAELATSEYHVQPRSLLLNLGKIGDFEWGRQEDACEFMYGFFQAMQQALFLEAEVKPSPDQENTTWLHQLFGGYSKYARRCLGCDHTSETTDYFLSIQLNLAAGQSVEELLRSFFYASGHVLEDYVCSACKSAKGHDQRSLLYQAHPILVVQLMRFDHRGVKLNNPVAFRSELELRPVLHPDVIGSSNAVYDLYGVVVHYGRSRNMGHYVAFVKVQGVWFLADDTKITPVPEAIVLQQSAYMLFYKRRKQDKIKSVAPSKMAVSADGSTAEAAAATTTTATATPATTIATATPAPLPFAAYYRLDAAETTMLDVVVRVSLPAGCATDSARVQVLPATGGVLVEVPGAAPLSERFEFAFVDQGFLAKLYKDARVLVLVLPISSQGATGEKTVDVAVTVHTGDVYEQVDAGCLLKKGPEPAGPPVQERKTASTGAVPRAVTQTNWHEEASYKALYAAIEKAKLVAKSPLASHSAAAAAAAAASTQKDVKRNDPCPCGSGKKWKNCHGQGK